MDLAAQHRQVATCAPRRTHSHVWGTGRWGSARRRSSFHRWTFWVWGRTLGQLLLGVGVLRTPPTSTPWTPGHSSTPREASFLRTSLPSHGIEEDFLLVPGRHRPRAMEAVLFKKKKTGRQQWRQADRKERPTTQLVSAHNRFQAFSAHPTNLKATGKELQIYSHAGP